MTAAGVSGIFSPQSTLTFNPMQGGATSGLTSPTPPIALACSPQVVAAGLLVAQAARTSITALGKELLKGYAMGKAIEKLDEGIKHALETKGQREERLRSQLNNDLLYGHVRDLMSDTERTFANPQIPFAQKILKINNNQATLEAILAQNMTGRTSLSEEETFFLRTTAQKSEQCIKDLFNFYDLAKDAPKTDSEKDKLLTNILDRLGQLDQIVSGVQATQQKVEKASLDIEKALHMYLGELRSSVPQPQIVEPKSAGMAESLLRTAQAGFEMGALIARVTCHHQLAHQILGTGQLIPSVTKSIAAIKGLLASSAGLTAIFPHYVALATAASSLFSLFSGPQKQDQAMFAAILRQLGVISKQVAQLRDELHARFDGMEELLTEQHREVLKEFAQLHEHEFISAVQLSEVSHKIDTLSLKTLIYAQENYVKDFQDYLSALHRHTNMHGDSHPGNSDELLKWASTFYLWAVTNAKKPKLLTDSISYSQTLTEHSLSDISLHLDAMPLEGNIQFLAKYASSLIPDLRMDPVNGLEWSKASNAYLFLRNSFPALSFDPKGKCISEMIECGEERQRFSERLQSSVEFFTHLCNNYRESIHATQHAMTAAVFDLLTPSVDALKLKYDRLKTAVQHEQQGASSPSSALAKYRSSKQGFKRLSKLTMDYDRYIKQFEENLNAQMHLFQSRYTSQICVGMLSGDTSQLELPPSPSSIVFFKGIPIDLNNHLKIPKNILIAELLGLGKIEINLQIKKHKVVIEDAHFKGSPFTHGRYQKNYNRFVISAKFISQSGEQFEVAEVESQPLFFPGHYWVRNAIKEESKPPKDPKKDETGTPKRWGKSKHENERNTRYGDVDQALQAGELAYLLSNVSEAKFSPSKSFDLKAFELFFEKAMAVRCNQLHKQLYDCISAPTNLSGKQLSTAVTALDARQKLLKGYCLLAFPVSFAKDFTFQSLAARDKTLWTKAEIHHFVNDASWSTLLVSVNEFEKKLKDKLKLFKSSSQFEKDPLIADVCARLKAFKLERY